MKVIKFGGKAVASQTALNSLLSIIKHEAKQQDIIIVVSALDGITDALIDMSHLALNGDKKWSSNLEQLSLQHLRLAQEVLSEEDFHELSDNLKVMIDELKSILLGVYLVHDLSKKTLDAIVSYGERLSAIIVGKLCKTPTKDAREFIKTHTKDGKQVLDADLTDKLIRKAFLSYEPLTIVPGFIASDKDTNETTNLGRGGSDYTASIIAAALNAETLDIWTDVNGFMTADPKQIPGTYTISELSYIEAMELCNFGAKVIYPPTIYPVCTKNIPIHIRNIFNPKGAGTIIKQNIENDSKPIKGISSISGTSLITVTGLSMVGVVGVNRRIFTTLANNGISVFLVSQASSENSTSIGVRDEDSHQAVSMLNQEFSREIADGRMYPMHAECGLATIAIVGENMKHAAGIAGKLFGTLGRSGISVIACAQGASETNISFVVDGNHLNKALNVLHGAFFLSEYKELNLFICGVGTVGGKLIEQIKTQYETLKQTRRLKLNVVGIASSHNAIYNSEGLDLNNYKQALRESEPSSPEKLRDAIIQMNTFNAVFIDCTASHEVASLYQNLLEHNVSIVAANKIAASSDYISYKQLKQTAIRKGVKFRFETNVGAGLPIIGTINDLKDSGDKILKIEAVLSGTLNFIFNTISAKTPFSEAVKQAKLQGYSEPDPRIDLSGTDVIRKLVILTREAGYPIEQNNVETHLFVPDEYFNGSLEDFWKTLPQLDEEFELKRKCLENEGKRWRFVATMDRGRANVALKAVDKSHPFYNLEGSNNIVLLTTERYREYPMLIQGYGAGASVTAAGVFANIMSIANI